MNNIFKEMDRFTDRNKNNKVDCKSALRQNDGTCLGYGYSEDDEPIEQCKLCKKCSSPYEDLEVQDDKQRSDRDIRRFKS